MRFDDIARRDLFQKAHTSVAAIVPNDLSLIQNPCGEVGERDVLGDRLSFRQRYLRSGIRDITDGARKLVSAVEVRDLASK